MPKSKSATRLIRHKYVVGANVRIVKDLSGTETKMVGCYARIQELLPAAGRYPQYKAVIFGEKSVIGGVFEVDERELGVW